MLLDRWRARRALRTRSAPTPIEEPGHPRLFELVESLKPHLDALDSLGDPTWHFRWEGDVQLVGLDATDRSLTDVRQRLARLVHELAVRHLQRRRQRVLAVVLVRVPDGEDLRSVYARLDDDQGEVADWRGARRQVTLLLVDADGRHVLFGGDRSLVEAVRKWEASRNAS